MFKYTLSLCTPEMTYYYKLDSLYDYKDAPSLEYYRRMPDFKGVSLQSEQYRPYKDDGIIMVNDSPAAGFRRLQSEFDNRTINYDGLHTLWRVFATFELGEVRYIGSISQVKADL